MCNLIATNQKERKYWEKKPFETPFLLNAQTSRQNRKSEKKKLTNLSSLKYVNIYEWETTHRLSMSPQHKLKIIITPKNKMRFFAIENWNFRMHVNGMHEQRQMELLNEEADSI